MIRDATFATWHTAVAMSAAVIAFGACMLLPASSILRPLASTTLLAAIGIASWYGMVIVSRASEHRRLVRLIGASSVPGVEGGIAVAHTAGIREPFVAGLRKPAIYWPADLAARMEPDELRAVLLHEQHHRLTNAPLRLILIDALETGFPIEAIREWARRARASVEVAADRYALDSGADRSALASALITLSAGEPSGGAGFASASELRVRALLEDGNFAPSQGGSAALALGVLLVSLSCLAFYLR